MRIHWSILLTVGAAFCAPAEAQMTRGELVQLERGRVLSAARTYLDQAPITITAYPAARSAGRLHDYYSEGDYWWPDPENPNGPYVRRDGETNPDNFVAHRDAMRRLSQIRHPALLFGGRALDEPRNITLWKRLEADPTVDEVIRNFPVRQPLLWVEEP